MTVRELIAVLLTRNLDANVDVENDELPAHVSENFVLLRTLMNNDKKEEKRGDFLNYTRGGERFLEFLNDYVVDDCHESEDDSCGRVALILALLRLTDAYSVGKWVLDRQDLAMMHKALRNCNVFKNGRLESAVYIAWDMLVNEEVCNVFSNAMISCRDVFNPLLKNKEKE